MNAARIYARTAEGNAEFSRANGKIVGDEKRVMMLIDGTSDVESISKKIPPSVRQQMDEILQRLVKEHFIAPVGTVSVMAPLKHHTRIPSEKVQEAMMSSQKFSKNVLALAEIEIERRLELEQDLAESQAKLDETTTRLESVVTKYETLKEQVLLYKQGMETKIAAQQAQLAALSGRSDGDVVEKQQLEHALQTMRSDFEHMQKTIQQKTARLDETVQVRVLQQQQAEFEKRKTQKIAADQLVQTHPHFHEIRALEFFKKFRNSDLAEMLVWAEWRDIKANEVVVTEGQSDITFYIIVSGRFSLLKGKRAIQVLLPGEPFGEIAYLTGEEPTRTATVVARSDGALLQLNPAYLDDAELMIRMLFAESFMRVQARRLRTSLEMLGNLLTEGAN